MRQPATDTGTNPARPPRPRPPLPDRAPLRPAAYVAGLTARRREVEPATRTSWLPVIAGAGALSAMTAVVVGIVVAVLLSGAWLLVRSLAG